MDLSDFFLRQADRLQRQLQTLLEKPASEVREKPFHFSASTDLSLMKDAGLHLPIDFDQKTVSLFYRMSPFFEAGVLFHRVPQSLSQPWRPVAAFQRGEMSELSDLEKKLEFDFPALNLVEVKRASSRSVIEDLGFDDALLTEHVNALVFRPHPDILVLFLCALAEPWMKLQVDRAQRLFLDILSDEV